MKTLYIIRHAKSSWDFSELHDLERPLIDRGINDAAIMGSLMRKKNVHPSIVLSSPALRAFTTARIICTEIGFDVNKIEIEPALYFKEASEIINNIQGKTSLHDSIMLFGHNPTFSHLSHMLCSEFYDTMPTCSVVAIEFNVKLWKLIYQGAGNLCFFEYPKKYRH